MKIKIAYLLLAHKEVEQINLLVNQLNSYGDCDIFIHVDKKSEKMIDKIIPRNNLTVLCVKDVRWGSFEIVDAAIILMKKMLESKNEYSHVYFGSCQDMLVKKGLYEYLSDNPNKVFLKIVKKITNKDRESARYKVKWPKKYLIRNDLHIYRFVRIFIQYLCKFGIVFRKNRNVLNTKMDFYEGHTWFLCPHEVISYIINFINDNMDYYKFWENSLASDLMFFQTIIMNSPYKNNIEDELMYVRFGNSFRTMNHPLTINKDFIKEIDSGLYFYARKFEFSDQEIVKYYIEKTIGENNDC